jgi:methylenetetrahydrofolate--tRNA-(uracil-5-)-methyltransferase
MAEVTVIGGGLAGCEAAYQVARLGGRVTLYEMKPVRFSPAHKDRNMAELVCSNSLKSLSLENASGLLKEEMRRLDSLVIRAAGETRVPAGKALAVDRARFARYITETLIAKGVSVVREEVVRVPEEKPVIIATGPLTSDALAEAIHGLVGEKRLFFYDAISPIVYRDSIDPGVSFRASRYGKGEGDYINCPMTEDEYRRFVGELTGALKTPLREFEKIPFFEGCLPVETLAERGPETLAHGPLRPVGLDNPRGAEGAEGAEGKVKLKPHAVVQLRRENVEDTLYNMVGFQTRLTHQEQKSVFRLIPGLERARFARLGSIHRNSYIDSPLLLEDTGQLKKDPAIFFAGQITGVEGYCESAASGLVSGINAFLYAYANGMPTVCPPRTTMTGALLRYISRPSHKPFQPMNANFGLLPHGGGKKMRMEASTRALEDLDFWYDKVLATCSRIW